jgi:hypothetical protein
MAFLLQSASDINNMIGDVAQSCTKPGGTSAQADHSQLLLRRQPGSRLRELHRPPFQVGGATYCNLNYTHQTSGGNWVMGCYESVYLKQYRHIVVTLSDQLR